MSSHTHDPHQWDYAGIERVQRAQAEAERTRTPRLRALVDELTAREWSLRFDYNDSEQADAVLEELDDLRMDLGWREVEPGHETRLRSRFLVGPVPVASVRS